MDLGEKLFFWLCTFTASAIGAIIGYWVSRQKAFESEKGKNLATKEDIGAITRIVEKEKNLATKEDIGAITKEVEAIKSQLVFSTQAKLSLKLEERNALISHYEKVSYWIEISMKAPFPDFKKLSTNELDKAILLGNDAYIQTFMALSKLQLFVRSENVYGLAADLTYKSHSLFMSVKELSIECTKRIEQMNAYKTTLSFEECEGKFVELHDDLMKQIILNDTVKSARFSLEAV